MGRQRSAAAQLAPILLAPILPAPTRLAPLLVLIGSLGAACRLAPAKTWNLQELHHPDGTPRYRGRIENDVSYLFRTFAEQTNYGGEEFRERSEEEKSIDDPFGSCFENVRDLGDCARDEKVAGLQAAAFAWLAVDCTYALSRERCVLELGALAADLRLGDETGVPPAEPATAEAVQAALDELLAALRSVLPAPDLAGGTLSEVAARIRALPLDRDGAVRLLRATNALLASERKAEKAPVLAPLRELRLALARRAVAMALREARDDPIGRVRAAALEAGLRAFPDERGELLRWGLTVAMPGVEDRAAVSLRALEFLARYGLPPSPAGEDPSLIANAWRGLLEQIVRLQIDGPNTTAACRALAKVTGEGHTFRPEVWLARARERAEAGALRPPATATP